MFAQFLQRLQQRLAVEASRNVFPCAEVFQCPKHSCISQSRSPEMSGRMSKLPRGESVGALSQRETEVAAELIHRAIVHEQGNAIVQKVASHIHGKQIAVHVQSLMVECQGMSDASKRRHDETDAASWDHIASEEEFDPSCMPMPSGGYGNDISKGNTKAKMADHAPTSGQHVFAFPPKVNSMDEWGRTIITMKKYADLNITYGELVTMSRTDLEASKYLGWIVKTYTPEPDRMKTVKRTQAVDMAMYLKNIGWSMDETPEEFVRRLK